VSGHGARLRTSPPEDGGPRDRPQRGQRGQRREREQDPKVAAGGARVTGRPMASGTGPGMPRGLVLVSVSVLVFESG